MTIQCGIPHDADSGMAHVLENMHACLRLHDDAASAIVQLTTMYCGSGYVVGKFSHESSSCIRFEGTIFGLRHSIACDI